MSKLIPHHGSYRKLKSFQIAQLCYDITVRFVERYIDKYSRTTDQMVQAARSGVQNIAEGSQASGTSKKTEIKLTQVARASLEELKLDYEDFLRQQKLESWSPGNPLRKEIVAQRFKTADEVANWIKSIAQNYKSSASKTQKSTKNIYAEISANSILVLISVSCVLLDRQINRLANDFKEKGGFTERLYQTRKSSRQE